MIKSKQYEINNSTVQTLMQHIREKTIGIPNMQRAFVWEKIRVQKLIDSLYRGYPIGYIIAWVNPTIRLKDNEPSTRKLVIIDGQQRIKAIMTALLREKLVDKNYKAQRIQISFHPTTEEFKFVEPGESYGPEWVDDIADFFDGEYSFVDLANKYSKDKPQQVQYKINTNLTRLFEIPNNSIGIIHLHENMASDNIADIFIRINSEGIDLEEPDFVMTRLAVDKNYTGQNLHKKIEHFAQFAAQAPNLDMIHQDEEFIRTKYYRQIKWLQNFTPCPYIPAIEEIIEVAAVSDFELGSVKRLRDGLSGIDTHAKCPVDRKDVSKRTYVRFEGSLENLTKERNFREFSLLLQSSGFQTMSLAKNKNVQDAMNFSYAVFLAFKKKYSSASSKEKFERCIKRLFVLSIISRYAYLPRLTFDRSKSYVINKMKERGLLRYVDNITAKVLSKDSWSGDLRMSLDLFYHSHFFDIFVASQITAGDKGFLSKNKTVASIFGANPSRHHIFPKAFLAKQRAKSIKSSRAVATAERRALRILVDSTVNIAITDMSINEKISDTPPAEYFRKLRQQCDGGRRIYGDITDNDELLENFKQHCIPDAVEKLSYSDFLHERQKLMSEKNPPIHCRSIENKLYLRPR